MLKDLDVHCVDCLGSVDEVILEKWRHWPRVPSKGTLSDLRHCEKVERKVRLGTKGLGMFAEFCLV